LSRKHVHRLNPPAGYRDRRSPDVTFDQFGQRFKGDLPDVSQQFVPFGVAQFGPEPQQVSLIETFQERPDSLEIPSGHASSPDVAGRRHLYLPRVANRYL
jgi:hypothetical protein